MAKGNEKAANLAVTFVGMKEGESAPRFAAYQLDRAGRPVKKLGVYDGKTFNGDFEEAAAVAFGPDAEDFKTLPPESLALYRVSDQVELWRKQGLVFAQDTWQRFRFFFTCVTGTVRKCRPWYWDLIDDIRVKPLYQFAHGGAREANYGGTQPAAVSPQLPTAVQRHGRGFLRPPLLLPHHSHPDLARSAARHSRRVAHSDSRSHSGAVSRRSGTICPAPAEVTRPRPAKPKAGTGFCRPSTAGTSRRLPGVTDPEPRGCPGVHLWRGLTYWRLPARAP